MIFDAHPIELRTSPSDSPPATVGTQEPPPLPRAMLYTVLAPFAALFVWSFFGRIDIVATAPGRLVPRTSVQIVQSAEAGIVAEVLVREGDRVRAGQLLLRLDTSASSADAAVVRREMAARTLQLERIDSEMAGRAVTRGDSNYRRLLSERFDAQSALDKARAEDATREHPSRSSEMRARQDGIIKDMSACAVGALVDAGTVLMSVVPVHEQLVAEVQIRTDDVGLVHEGQRAKVKLSSYPFQQYGMIEGTVVRISADPSGQNRAQGAGQGREALSPYKAVVELEAQLLHGAGADWPIAPGMQVVAEVRQGDRTVMEYLLSPVSRQPETAGLNPRPRD